MSVAFAPLSSVGELLGSHLAVVVRAAVDLETCARWTEGVLAAREQWTEDFDGDQFCLGRAFYTHLETDRAGEYFEDAADSDARVEAHVPGLQTTMQALVEKTVAARVVRRSGWCGAGVHIFPVDGVVATRGGVVHFDTEGLAEVHVARRAAALSFVLMLCPPAAGGGLRLWPVRYAGEDHVDERVLGRGGDAVVTYEAGDLVVFDSYRCHQIQPFAGGDRISSTLHAAAIDRDLWETWF